MAIEIVGKPIPSNGSVVKVQVLVAKVTDNMEDVLSVGSIIKHSEVVSPLDSYEIVDD